MYFYYNACIFTLPLSNRFNVLSSTENDHLHSDITPPSKESQQSSAPPQSNNLMNPNDPQPLNNPTPTHAHITLNNPIPLNDHLQINIPIPSSTTTEPNTAINPLSHNTPPANAQLINNNSLPPMYNDNSAEPYSELLSVRTKHPTNIIIAHININSFRLKFSEVDYIIRKNSIQILAIAETKLDESDNSNLFHIEGYSMLRADKRKNSGGLLMYISNKIPHRLINFNSTSPNVEIICCEIILDKKRHMDCLCNV